MINSLFVPVLLSQPILDVYDFPHIEAQRYWFGYEHLYYLHSEINLCFNICDRYPQAKSPSTEVINYSPCLAPSCQMWYLKLASYGERQIHG